MKTFFLILISCLFPLPALSQFECNLTLKDSPEIRGLKLGMKKQEVEKIIPPSSDVILKNFINHLTAPQLSKLKGFESLDFLDIIFMRESFESDIYQISSLTFKYKNDIEWDGVYFFAHNLSKNLKLPSDAWFISDSDEKGSMKCKDFRIEIYPNYIRLESTKNENRIKELKEQRKKDFKP